MSAQVELRGAGAGVPHLCCPVCISCDDPLAIGIENCAGDGLCVPTQYSRTVTGRNLPDPRCVIRTPCDHKLAVWAEPCTVDRSCMATQDREAAPSIRVPDSRRTVCTRGHDKFFVGAEHGARETVAVSPPPLSLYCRHKVSKDFTPVLAMQLRRVGRPQSDRESSCRHSPVWPEGTRRAHHRLGVWHNSA